MRFFKRAFAAVALLAVSSNSALGGAMTGGSTEITQLMNNGLLARSVAHEATMVANHAPCQQPG